MILIQLLKRYKKYKKNNNFILKHLVFTENLLHINKIINIKIIYKHFEFKK